jgi:hypothetical protein
MPGTNERQTRYADNRQPTAGGPAGASRSEYILPDNEIQGIFSRSGWHVCPYYPADRFMAKGVTTLGAWKFEQKGPCFQGSEPSFLVCFLSETVADGDSALKVAHAVSWSLGHRVLLVMDRRSVTLFDSSGITLQNDHVKVLASAPYPGPEGFDKCIRELLSSYAEPRENFQDYVCFPQNGVPEADGCSEALVSLVTRLAETLSRKIHSCEPGLSGVTHDKLVIRLLFGILFISILTEQYGTNGIKRENPGRPDLASLHATIIRGIIQEMAAGHGEVFSTENLIQISGILLKESYGPLILSLVPPRTFSYAFDSLSLIKSVKKKKKRPGWLFGKKYTAPLSEGHPRIPDALARYCTGRLSLLLKERSAECTTYPVVLDPRCGNGQFLLYMCEGVSQAFQGHFREMNTGSPAHGSFPRFNSTAEKEEVLHSVYGLDPDPAKADSARFVLFLWLNRNIYDLNYLSRQAWAFFSGSHHLYGTIRNCQVLFAPDLLSDLNRALLGPERAGKIHPFDLDREFPVIAQRGSFDAVTGNFIRPSHRLSRDIREYLQGHFVTYDPGADCSVYMLEKSVNLLKKQGICCAVHNCGWTGASFAGRLRNLISSMQIIEMTEVTKQQREEGQGQDYGILIFSKEPPSKDIIAAKVTSGPCRELFRQAHLKRNMIEHPGRGTGGWTFRDPRSIRLKHAITRHGIPLERYAMGELYRGIDWDSARFFLTCPENFDVQLSLPGNPQLLPFVKGKTLRAYCPASTSGILAVPSRNPDTKKTGNILHSINATRLTNGDPDSCHLTDPEELMSLISRIRKYAEMKEKILIPIRTPWPACTFDQAGCVPDESILFIPHRDFYLLAFLNSSIPEFLMTQRTRDESLKNDGISPQWIHRLPVHVIDGSDENESRLHDRIVLLAERIIRLKAIRVQERDDRMAREIDSRVRTAAGEINRCFYSIYGFSKDETDVIERFCRDCPGN